MKTKQNYQEVIENYYNSENFTEFKSQYLNHLDSKDTISRIKNLKLNKINEIFNYIFNHLNNNNYDHYKYTSMSINNIVNTLKLQSQVITFTINLFIEIKILDKNNSIKLSNKTLSSKYKLLSIEQTNNTEKIDITFKPEISEVFKKSYNKLKQQKSRLIKKNECTIAIEKKINKLKNYKLIFSIFNNEGGITKEKFNESQITNGRLSHYFVNINKEYRDYILLNNEETDSIDFRNSQPSFLANHLMTLDEYNTKEDVITFYNECITGIYEYIADKLNITRNQSKDLWMKVAYGKPYLLHKGDEATIINKKAQEFYKLFPNVIKFADDMKNKDIKNTSIFSNFLCELEAKPVNEMSDLLKNLNYLNVTIYDEFIFKLKDKNKVIKIIQDYLKDNNINVSLKITDKNIDSNEVKEESNEIILQEKESSLEAKELVKELVSDYTKEDLLEITLQKYNFNKDYLEEFILEMHKGNKTITEYKQLCKAVNNSKYKIFPMITNRTNIQQELDYLNKNKK